MTDGVRDPGYLPNVLARVEMVRARMGQAGLEPEIEEVLDGVLALATTQHELNKRLWESKKGVPEPHADSHIWGDDAIGGNLGSGSISNASVRTVSFDTVMTDDDWLVRGDAAGGPLTVTLPPASDRPGRLVAVAKVDATVNQVTIAPSGANTLAGDAAPFDLLLESEVLSLMSTGNDWTVV